MEVLLHVGLGLKGIEDSNPAALEVGGVAGGEGEMMKEGGGGDEHVGGIADDAPCREISPHGSRCHGNGGRDPDDLAMAGEEFIQPETFDVEGLAGETEDQLLEGDDADLEARLAFRPSEHFRRRFPPHELADDVRIDQEHGSGFGRKRIGGGGTAVAAGREIELLFLSEKKRTKTAEGLGNAFGLFEGSGARRLDDGDRFTAQGDSDGFTGIADILEKAKATGFEIGYLERFHAWIVNGHLKWSSR